jgi:hypothetical protein
MTAAYKPLDATIRQVLGRSAVNHVYEYEKSLFDFDSKYITQPGNLKAIQYLEKTYRSFGYDPEVQWFTPPALQASNGTNGQHRGDAQGHRQSRAHLRREQPLRFSRGRARR